MYDMLLYLYKNQSIGYSKFFISTNTCIEQTFKIFLGLLGYFCSELKFIEIIHALNPGYRKICAELCQSDTSIW